MGPLRTAGLRASNVVLSRCAAALAWAAVCVLPAGAAAPPGPVTRTTRPPAPAHTHTVVLSAWEQAERARDSLEATPDTARTRADYNRVMDRFRAIYHDNPRDVHAPEAINAVAELLTEQGRTLHDARFLKAAIGQYEFLRTQYPGSSLRVGALLAEGEIAQNDLHDAAAAREHYQALIDQYPRSALAGQARDGLLTLRNPHGAVAADVRQGSARDAVRGASPAVAEPRSAGSGAQAAQAPGAATPGQTTAARTADTFRGAESARPAQAVVALPPPREVAHRAGPLATVSGIRHWSTPTYTRVAIDLGSEVEYEAARVPSPDRIFFDLHGAHLAADLLGKSFAVTDDGFLKRIRLAQSGSDVTRVVLDVNDVTEYSAFLLPNPYRLIIDIHGKPRPPAAQQFASVDAPAPHAATVPNTRAMRAGSPTDVNNLSNQPGKVDATSTPTSQPIATTVATRTGEPGGASPVTSTAAGSGPANAFHDGSPAPARGLGESSAAQTATARASAADGRVVGDADPAATARSVAAAKRSSKKGSKAPLAADARVVGDPATPARAAAIHTADGETSLVRALGLKINRIVIDAGHGGHDSGTLGVGGLQEKDVVLDVALRLGALLHDRLGAEVIYTRSDDTFIPLETRTAIANKAQADLFLSIHANSSPDATARGVETYYLNFTQQADALDVAARENAVSGQSIHQLSDLVRKITLKDKLAESREFASDVETSLYGGLARPLPTATRTAAHGGRSESAAGLSASFSTGTNLPAGAAFKDRGVKKAPFVVLIGANMPSVLAEISFLTNARDASLLLQADYKQRVAESLFRGVSRYVGSLSSTAPATAVTTERAAATGQ